MAPRFLPALLVALALLAGPAATAAPPRAGFIRGVALGEIHPGHEPAAYGQALDRLAGLDADWVLLPVFGYVDSAAAPAVSPEWEPPHSNREYRALVRRLVREAHARRLRVLLIPYLNLRHGTDKDWRGNLRPPDWDRWFESYIAFLAPWIDLAREEQVEMLAVGAELVSSERRVESWRQVIAAARRGYPGTLLYSCNWDHYREVAFLGDLDLVGLSGYYSLPWDAPLTEASLESNWREVQADLLLFSREVDRRVLFTEIGTPSILGAARDPWNYLMEGPPDAEGQARALAAFTRVWSGRPELAGVFFWNWSPFRGGAADRSYSINGKPAEGVVRSWFRTMGAGRR